MTKKKVVRIFLENWRELFEDFFLKIYFQKFFAPPIFVTQIFAPPNIYDKSTPLLIWIIAEMLFSDSWASPWYLGPVGPSSASCCPSCWEAIQAFFHHCLRTPQILGSVE